MILLASIRRGSIIDKRWRLLGHRGGVVSGVTFSLTDFKRDYESVGPVPEHLWSAMRGHESVRVAVVTEPAGIAQLAAVPPEPLSPLAQAAAEGAPPAKPTSMARPKGPKDAA
jgi:hypothetical protein